MIDPATLLAFAVASAILIVVPGPTVLMTVARSLAHGRSATWPLAFGVAAGDLVATSLSMLGVGALLAASATLFTLVKWAGAAYLIWIAIGTWRSADTLAGSTVPTVAVAGTIGRRLFRDAFLVTLFNPKGIVFFVAFAPQFIDASRAYAPQAAILVLTFTLIGFANVVTYALTASRARGFIARGGLLRSLTRGGAVALGLAGLATLFARRA